MKSINFWTIVFLLSALPQTFYLLPQSPAQNPNKQDGSAQQSNAAATSRSALVFGLMEDTAVKLRLSRTVSSQDARVAEKADFEVVEDVMIGDVVVIPRNATAIARVTEAKAKSLTHSGKLKINIEFVQL